MRIEHSVSFKNFTTLQVGGVADTVIWIEDEKELPEALLKTGSDFIILGGGSNTLAPDGNYSTTVLIPSLATITEKEKDDVVHITAGAGVGWDALVARAVEKGWWGIENLSAIPGTVGGAVFQNIGAYGAALSDSLVLVRAYDCTAQCVVEFTNQQCAFGYRASIFKKEAGRYVILSATFSLQKKAQLNVAYKDLEHYFGGSSQPSLAAVRDAVIEVRKNKFPNLDEYGTAGSFFLNPVVTEAEAKEFRERFPEMPMFTLPEGGIKIPLAWILDNIVHAKDMRVGGAFVWPHQALVVATEEKATARDVHELAKQIQDKVFSATKIKIVLEVRAL